MPITARLPFRGRFHARALIQQLQVYGLAAITLLSFFPRAFRLQEHAFFVLFIVAIGFAWVEKINPYVRTRLDIPLLAFISWVLITVPFAIDPAYSFSEWRKFIAHLLVFYWTTFVLRVRADDEPIRKVLFVMVVGSLALSIFALEDFILRGGSWRDRQIRAGAPSSDYNWLTTYFVLVIPILIGWVLTQSSRVTRGLGLFSLVTSTLAQVAAYTRAGWVAHFTQALGLVLMVRRQQLIVWILTGAVVAGSALIILPSVGLQQETVDPWTFSARVKTWRIGLQQVLEHPIVGIGYGNDTFSKVYAAEIEADMSKGPVEKVLPALHNTFAMVLMGAGVPALVLFLWMIVRTLQELLAGVRITSLPQSAHTVFRLAIALAVIGFMVRNLFDYMFAGSLASLFWIVVAIGVTQSDIS
ncbi:MAG TPA: O-antigen ligase family protein, partial [Nitrospiraceae bacterium]